MTRMTVLAALVSAVLVSAPSLATDQIALRGVNIIDVSTGQIDRGRTILVEDGVIRAILPPSIDSVPEGYASVDGGDGYVIPGLWDSHAHVLPDVERALGEILPAHIGYGITHVRDLGSNTERLTEVRARLGEGNLSRPMLIASGPILVEQELRWYGDIQRAIGGDGVPEATVSALRSAGVDFLKAYTGLSADSYRALMAAAAAHDLPVDGHVPDSVGLIGAVEAGQRTIEHLDLSAYATCYPGEDNPYADSIAVRFGSGLETYLELAAEFWAAFDWEACGTALVALSERGGAITPTLSMEIRDRAHVRADVIAHLPEQNRDWCEQGLVEFDGVDPAIRDRYYAVLQGVVRELDRRGVRMLAGTDTANHCIAPAVSLSSELERLAEAGLDPLTVLQTATLNPAVVFGASNARIAAGMTADFVLLPTNPLEDPAAYRAPSGVFTQGRWHDADALEALRRPHTAEIE